jgi:hypothetical protein
MSVRLAAAELCRPACCRRVARVVGFSCCVGVRVSSARPVSPVPLLHRARPPRYSKRERNQVT